MDVKEERLDTLRRAREMRNVTAIETTESNKEEPDRELSPEQRERARERDG